jgi:ribonuclease III
MHQLDILKNNFNSIEKKIGYFFKNKDILLQSFVHKSFVNEYRELVENDNERLEYLGDSVLGLIVSWFLYEKLPLEPEGKLSQLRSLIVDATSCFGYIKKLELDEHVLLGRGEIQNQGKGRENILADVFEALIGAIFIDGDFDTAKEFFLNNFSEDIEHVIQTPSINDKAILQDYYQKTFQKIPRYEVLKEEGPEHNKKFYVAVYIDEDMLAEGEGLSKKQAQQDAASNALKKLNIDNKNSC